MTAAARRLGVTPWAIRGRIRRGTIEWQPQGDSGRLVRVTAADVPQDELEELRAELTDALIAQARAEEPAFALREPTDRLTAGLAEARLPSWRRLNNSQ